MKNLVYILFYLFATITCQAQMSPQTKKITEKFFPENEAIENVTPALQKNKGFTNYEELIAFLERIKSQFPDKVSLTYIGDSQKGHAIPLLKITNPNNAQNKIRVWMQGGLHGNEPASSEGLLYLMHQLLNKPENFYLLDKIELAIVPMANIDGYLKQNRYAANGLDLNRDQTKLMAPESVVLKQAFSDFNPQVGLDFHEYNPYRKDFSKLSTFGITSYYDIMFLYSGNLNVPKNIRTITDSLFVENSRKILTQNNLSHHDYVSTDDDLGEIILKQGSSSARSSATSYALTNTISTLIEVRGVGIGKTSFKRRINTAYLIGMSYLKTSYDHAAFVKKEILKAQNSTNEVTVTSASELHTDTLKVIDLDTENVIDLEIDVKNALKSKSELARQLPEAYLIDANQELLIAKLKIVGIEVEQLKQETAFEVETYLVTAYKRNNVPYEKMNLQDVETKLVKSIKNFQKGTYKISTRQKNTPLLLEIIEPEAPNSFVSFGVLKTNLNEELPIYRLPKKELK